MLRTVHDLESGRGALGVQIRPLREVIKEYDGEVCMLRFKEGWTGKTIDPNDAVRAATQISLRWFGSEGKLTPVTVCSGSRRG